LQRRLKFFTYPANRVAQLTDLPAAVTDQVGQLIKEQADRLQGIVQELVAMVGMTQTACQEAGRSPAHASSPRPESIPAAAIIESD
jgi:hypothetical protein